MQEPHRRGLHPGDGWFSLVEFSHLAATARWSDVGQQGAVPGPTNIQPSLAWKSQLPAYIPPEPWGHLHQPLLMPSTPGVGCTGANLAGLDDGAAGNAAAAAVHPRPRLYGSPLPRKVLCRKGG
jgi:hypothetical protein